MTGDLGDAFAAGADALGTSIPIEGALVHLAIVGLYRHVLVPVRLRVQGVLDFVSFGK